MQHRFLFSTLVAAGACLALAGCFGMSKPDAALYDTAIGQVQLDDKTNFPEADKVFADLHAKYPDDVEISAWRAQLLLAWGESLRLEARAIQVKRDQIKAMHDRAQSDFQMKRFKDRAAATANMETLKGQLTEMDDIIARWTKEAEELIQRGMDIVLADVLVGDQSHRVWRVQADYYRLTGDRSKVQGNLAVATSINPNSAGVRFIKGAVAMTMDKDYATAVKFFDEALEIDPKFTKARYYKALAQVEAGQADEAAATMAQVLMASPNHLGAKTYLKMADYLTEAKKQMEAFDAEIAHDDEFPAPEPAAP